MERSRKRLRVCLFFIVLVAIAAGLIYYFSDVRSTGEIEDGVMITGTGVRMERILR